MISRMPLWLKQDPLSPQALWLIQTGAELGINTVCQQALCPNLSFCFKRKELTFLILGPTCTRSCRFCAVKKSSLSSLGLDSQEPIKIARMVEYLGLSYVVITSVTRDDLVDGGAGQFSHTIRAIKSLNRDIKIEVLVPDFKAEVANIKVVVSSKPDVFAHNIETVSRLYPALRPGADYARSLFVLRQAKIILPEILTKSSIMVGLGEEREEIYQTLVDLRKNGCDMVTIGQYLAPSKAHYPVYEYVGLNQFENYESMAKDLGFKAVASGPKVRSSYNAQQLYRECLCMT